MISNTNDFTDEASIATILAIRGAIQLGMRGGPQGPAGHWLNEFWHVGQAAAQDAQLVSGFQRKAAQELLATSYSYLMSATIP
ncbi:hypothetical protein [Cupriavidus basilensis]|uniref:hypothetical protein n=1 Tax=Cupriavidus basilensis TaxID=68895 RepID=UPI0020A68AD5|nr:hypothetical protein [Cupriavidus basilensis]MCP3018244.1 hypothetical protein [Cupriavidus basilensis]